jgi:hypothetical protein
MFTRTRLALLSAAIIFGAASAAQAGSKDDADHGHSHTFGVPAKHHGKYHASTKHINHHASIHEGKTESTPK